MPVQRPSIVSPSVLNSPKELWRTAGHWLSGIHNTADAFALLLNPQDEICHSGLHSLLRKQKGTFTKPSQKAEADEANIDK